MMASTDAAFSAQLDEAVSAAMTRACSLFDDLAVNTRGTSGITRTPYGEGEEYAHRLLFAHARQLGLRIERDAAGNLYIRRQGRRPDAAAIMIGSHLDSVPNGGNYDGAAGVIAGLAVLEAFDRLEFHPARNVTVMAIRAEEAGSWFKGRHGGHLGSRMALGLIEPGELDTAIRVDSGCSLSHHLKSSGLDPERAKARPPHLDARGVDSYFELHIEQGPVLEMNECPTGIVTAIRGNSRLRDARCVGAYNHGGATPQEAREDAVIATSELVLSVDSKCSEMHAAGEDLVFAFGQFSTDPALHSLSKVPGEVRFSLDMRSGSSGVLARMREFVTHRAMDVGTRRKVRFELGDYSVSEPTTLDESLRGLLHTGCEALGLRRFDLASGGGHDAQEFARAGIPSCMIFVRNANGSHVPEEAMAMSDFELGTRLLAWAVAMRSSQ